MFGFLDMMGSHSQRKIANDEVDGGVVDTCAVTDSAKPFETGIAHPAYNDGEWVIVELYDTREEAEEGHRKWVKVMEGRPETLIDANQSEMGGFVDALGGNSHETHQRKQENA